LAKSRQFRRIRYYNFGRIRRARLLADDAHAGQYRKERLSRNRLSYSVHTTGVAEYLMAMGADENLVIAGHLHNTLEDTNLTEKEILENFGSYVLALVKFVTEPKGKSWQERKEYKINVLKQGSLATKMLGAADHCDNLLSILEAMRKEGLSTPEEFTHSKVWQNFKQAYQQQKWYHQESCKAIFANVPYEDLHPLFGKLMRLVEIIFGEKIISDPKIRRKVQRRKKEWINPYQPRKIKRKQKP